VAAAEPPPTTMCSVFFHSSSRRNRAVDRRQVAGKLLNGRVHETSCQRIVALKILVERVIWSPSGRRVTERVCAVLRDVFRQ